MAKQFIIHVSKTFQVPEVYTSESVDDIQEALWIGATIQESVRAYRSDSTVLKLQDDYKKEIYTLKNLNQEHEKELQKEIKNLEEERHSLQDKYIIGLKLARAEGNEMARRELDDKVRSIETKLDLLEDRKRFLEETRQDDIHKAVETERIVMERVISEKEKEITRMESVMKALQEAIGKNSEEIGKLGGTIAKRITSNVKLKGSIFENEFHDSLVHAYGTIRDFDLKNTAHGGGHEGDYIMSIEGEQVMWELKDYTADVPKKEVEKLFRDIKDCKGAKIGVMVSRVSDIAGRHGAIVTEIVDNRLLIYVNKYDDWDSGSIGGIGLFQILLQIFRTWWKIHDRIQEKGELCVGDVFAKSEELRVATQRLDDTLATIQKQAEDLKLRRTEWRTHKGRMEDMSRWISRLLDESNSNLESILRCLRDIPEEAKYVFRELTIDEKRIFQIPVDDRDNEWLALILRHCSISMDPDSYIELLELENLILEEKKMAKDTIRSHILRCIQDDAVRKRGSKKVIMGLKKA